MKILIYDPGNFVPDYNYCLCKALKDNYPEDEIVLIAYEKNWDKRQTNFKLNNFFFKIVENIKLLRGPIKKIFKGIEYLVELILFIFYVIRKSPDVIHIQWFPVLIADIIVFKIIGYFDIKLIYTVHNVLPHKEKFYHKWVYNIVYKIPTILIIHSDKYKKNIEKLYGTAFHKKIHIIPHGDFKKLYEEYQLNKNVNNNSDKIIFLFFGLIKEYKGLDILLKAVGRIKDQIKDKQVVFKIYGKVKTDFSQYEKIIQNKGIENLLDLRFEFIDEEEIPAIFHSCDVVILPYKNIYQSGVALLAYTFDIPIIASSLGGLKELIEEGKSGILFQKNNVKELSEIIYDLVRNPEKVDKMKMYIKNKETKKYDLNIIAQKTHELYV
ncbi:MAG: glycosyltransferase [Kosmotoga sp.]|nr:MAG: glycosyltransferase [Kosmotoga sp.]